MGSRLQLFSKRNNTYNFRCPVCNDSASNKRKTRGYLLQNNNTVRFYCHNCNSNWAFEKFLNFVSPMLYDEYTKEKLLEKYEFKAQEIKEENKENQKQDYDKIFDSLTKISQLKFDHPIKKYIMNRKIPTNYHYKIFVVRHFKQWVNSIEKTFETEEYDEPRLIIPLLDHVGKPFGFIGRSFRKDKNTVKYITIKLDKTMPKIYGLDTVDLAKEFFAFEGPIDSMFIRNSIATCGSNIYQEVNKLQCNHENCIIVYDNQPRNKAVVDSMKNAIDAGYRVCIWPDNNKYKDVNDMVIGGYNPLDIEDEMRENAVSGLMANLRLAQWRKI